MGFDRIVNIKVTSDADFDVNFWENEPASVIFEDEFGDAWEVDAYDLSIKTLEDVQRYVEDIDYHIKQACDTALDYGIEVFNVGAFYHHENEMFELICETLYKPNHTGIRLSLDLFAGGMHLVGVDLKRQKFDYPSEEILVKMVKEFVDNIIEKFSVIGKSDVLQDNS